MHCISGHPQVITRSSRAWIEMEGSSRSSDLFYESSVKLYTSMPTVNTGNLEYVTATDSMPALSHDSKVGLAASTVSGCELASSNAASVPIQTRVQVTAECEIEACKVHGSELHASTRREENYLETDVEVFERLRKKWGRFFMDLGDELVVGEKIAEGGQAEIYSAEWTQHGRPCVLKVFREGFLLRDLEKQWPRGMLEKLCRENLLGERACWIYGATLLKNGRFAFWMPRYWGDLRMLIEFRKHYNDNGLPPFSKSQVGDIMTQIAQGMYELHKLDIIHKDIKASNILIGPTYIGKFDPRDKYFECYVADFESSVGVLGTRFWRAPEILQAARIKSHLFTQKSDVYSYAMTYYEVLTGCIPFEHLGRSDYNFIIEGNRPDLPDDIDPSLETLLSSCWHENPLERPSFEVIIESSKEIYSDALAPDLRGRIDSVLMAASKSANAASTTFAVAEFYATLEEELDRQYDARSNALSFFAMAAFP